MISRVKMPFAEYAKDGAISPEQHLKVHCGVSYVECIIAYAADVRLERGTDFLQLRMDASSAIMMQLHMLLCDVLTRSNLPAEVCKVSRHFLEHDSGLMIPASTWSVLLRLFECGTPVAKRSVLQIARGSDVIADGVICHIIKSLVPHGTGHRMLFDTIVQYYCNESHPLVVASLAPWLRSKSDPLAISDAFKRLAMHNGAVA